MKRLTIPHSLLWLALWLPAAVLQAQEASAIYNATTRVLTLKEYTPNEQLSADETKVADLYDPAKNPKWWNWEDKYYNWPTECKNATRVVIEEGFKNCPLATCYKMFYNFTDLKTIEGISNLNTASVTNMSCMFYNCSSLTTSPTTHPHARVSMTSRDAASHESHNTECTSRTDGSM